MSGTTATPWMPETGSPYDAHGEDLLVQFGGEVDPKEPHLGPLTYVLPAESPPTGWGSGNDQQYQTGHTQNTVTNPSMEQGSGVGPERAWPHYPHAVNPNPFRMLNAFQRSGTDSYSADIYRPETAAYWNMALDVNQMTAATRQRSPVNPVLDQFPSVPFVDTVPQYATPGGY